MAERIGTVYFQGEPLSLVGNRLEVGDRAPDVVLADRELKPAGVFSMPADARIVLTVPSIDTPVCDTEVRRFNLEAASLDPRAAIVVVSRDLPFAQARWCGAAGIDRVVMLSDYRDGSFGRAWGVYIEELGLLARAAFVLDRDGVVRYKQLVGEITQEPDYAAILAAAKEILR